MQNLHSRLVIVLAAGTLALACATPVATPIAVGPIQPASGERVVVDHSVLLVDTSSSISRNEQFPAEKALVQSLVSSMPDGSYEAGSIAFGGLRRDVHDLERFDRSGLGAYADDLSYLSEGTPLYTAFEETSTALEDQRGRAAITVLSDGIPSDPFGRPVPESRTLDAAAQLAENYDGKVCIHTVQVGHDPAGAAFLQRLSRITGCGSHRLAATLTSASALQAFQREVYLGAAPSAPPAPVAMPGPGDLDGDGVTDDRDQCPGTPSGARADGRGCWRIEGLNFATDSAKISTASQERLRREVLPVLLQEQDLKIRIDGHTDSRGSAAYNQALSERRAQSVRQFFVELGVDGERLQSKGFGEGNPIAPNDNPTNLRRNRRTEFTILD